MNPVTFVYAAERSGTTVLRLMLNAHPALNNPIEADFLFDHLVRQPDLGWAYDLEGLAIDRIFGEADLIVPHSVLDGATMLEDFLAQFTAATPGQLSLNIHRNLARAADLRPDAKVIHLLRDPRDVARSSIAMGWAGLPQYGVEKWHVAECDWEMHGHKFDPARVLEIRYEDLIVDPEGGLRKICDFLGVNFDPAMLHYYENTTYDAPNPALTFQWKHKMSERDVALVEARLGPLLTTRGYDPSGVSVVSPNPLVRFSDWIRNKAMIWRDASRRYGFLNILAEKIGRRLGLKSLQHGAQRRINTIVQAELK